MRGQISINGRTIGPGYPAYIIAEMSANHNQSFDQASEIVKVAGQCGADAVKLQTYTADTITIPCDNEYFRIKGTIWEGRTLHDLYGEAFTPWEWQPELKSLAESLGMDLFSTPFDNMAVDFLEEMDVCAYKIASFELVDLPLLARIAWTGKPVIMSTGMATLAEIDEAVATLRLNGCTDLALLKCTSAYPASPLEMNLKTIGHLSETFCLPAGLSDHTLGIAVPVAAAALGASLIEKHFTLSRSRGGADSAFSLEPEEFKAMVDAVREAEQAVGGISYFPSEKEQESRVFRRSLFVVEDVKAGEKFTAKNIRSIRPGHGLHPRFFNEVLGRKAVRNISTGTPLSWELVG